ncbi:MAG TPA: hypothetical protein VLK53_10645 [Gaiellaceae bacterium]|nr:hypothetical protein [Gaiellaceae bacterium]
MALTRREFLGGAAGAAVAGSGIYVLVDKLARAPQRRAAGPLAPEQHVLDGLPVVTDNGVEVLVPPLHHQVVTAKLAVDETPSALLDARGELEHTLAQLEAQFEPTPAGLGVTVAWGLPYFRRFLGKDAARHIPVDRRATAVRGKRVSVLEDAVRFPSDPATTILEDNDVAVLLRSDSLDNIADGSKALFREPDGIFRVTSVRKGFAGGGFGGARSLPKQMAVAAGVPGAELIPDTAELFLGFTSTSKAALGPPRIANFETLGYVDLGPKGLLAGGTHMHLSHIFEDLAAWYLAFDFQARVDTTFRPGLAVRDGTQTVAQGPRDTQTAAAVAGDYARHRRIGHSGAIQTTSRLQHDVVGPDGSRYPKGTAVPQRADFNTLDNPFFFTADPERDGLQQQAAAGVHFVVFNPTSDDFRRNRLAMDGVLPDGTTLRFDANSAGQGFNQVLSTTHRQNFLVPPRRHRSFPLAG